MWGYKGDPQMVTVQQEWQTHKHAIILSHRKYKKCAPDMVAQEPQPDPKERKKEAVKESLCAVAPEQGLQDSSEVDEGDGGRRAKPYRRDSGETAWHTWDISSSSAR